MQASISARRRRLAAALVSAAIVAAAAVTSAPSPVDAALANETFDPTPRVHGAVTVIGDSVLQGSVVSEPTLSDRLGEMGWGPIRARAGVGYNTGLFGASGEARATFWIRQWRSEGWDAPNVLVNLGSNDSGHCNRDVECARGAILRVVDEIGPGHRIWWPMITRHPFFQHQADTWNRALTEIAAERTDFFTWNWPAVLSGSGWGAGDNTHLTPTGYRERSRILAHEFTADLASAVRTGGPASLPQAVGRPSVMVPIEPARAIDTRLDRPSPVAAGAAIVVDVAGLVPAGTTAIAAYVSATETAANGYLTASGCDGPRPKVSAANYLAGETRGAVVVTPISASGTFCLFTLAEAHLLVDVQAAFVPADLPTDPASIPRWPEPLRLNPLSTPERLLDTRDTGRSRLIEIDAPDGAAAVSVSVTAVLSDEPGYVTAYPCSDDRPVIATVNHAAGEVISGAAFVPVSADGTICLWSLQPVDITVDITGTFSPDGALAFQSARPTRMVDTRTGVGGWSPLHGREQTIDAVVAPPEAAAVTGTLTIVSPMRNGFLRAWGCSTEPGTANVNALVGTVLANAVTTAVGTGGTLCLYAKAATSTVFDTTGWWLAAP